MVEASARKERQWSPSPRTSPTIAASPTIGVCAAHTHMFVCMYIYILVYIYIYIYVMTEPAYCAVHTHTPVHTHTHTHTTENRDRVRKGVGAESVVPRALLPDLPSPSPSRAANSNRGGSTPRGGLTSSCVDALTRSHTEGFLFGDAPTSSCGDALDEISPEIEISSAPDTTVSPPGDAGGTYTPPPQPLLTRTRSRDTPSPAAEAKTPRTPLDPELCPRGGGGGGMEARAPKTPPDHELMYPSPAPEVMALYAARTTPPPPAPILASTSQKSSI